MNKVTKITVYSLGSILAFALFFYFYPAAIFEAEVIERPEVRYVLDVSIQGLLNPTALPERIDPNLVIATSLTLKGWFLLVICLIGVPIMIGYRLATHHVKSNE